MMKENEGWETLDGSPVVQAEISLDGVETAPPKPKPKPDVKKRMIKSQLSLGLPDTENVFTGVDQYDPNNPDFVNFTALKAHKKKAALALGRGRPLRLAAELAGVTTRTVNDWFKIDGQFRMAIVEITNAHIRESYDFGARASAMSMDYLLGVVQSEDHPTNERMKAAMFLRRDFVDTQRTQALYNKMLEIEQDLLLEMESEDSEKSVTVIENRLKSHIITD